MALRKFGQVIVDLGFISDDQLELLLEEQASHPGERLGKIAEEMGLITDEQIAVALAEQMNLQVINLGDTNLNRAILQEITEAMAQMYRVIPVKLEDDVLTVATCEPQNIAIQDELRTFLGKDVRIVVASTTEVNKALERFYASDVESVETIIRDLENDVDLKKQAEALAGDGPIDLTSVEALADSAPVRKLLNMVLLLAIKDQDRKSTRLNSSH